LGVAVKVRVYSRRDNPSGPPGRAARPVYREDSFRDCHASAEARRTLSARPIRHVAGFEDIGKLPALIAGLWERRWAEEELDLVLGNNWLQVWGKIWTG